MAKKEETKKTTTKKVEKKTTTKKEKSNVNEVVIKIDGDTWTKAIDNVFKQKQKTVKIDGFRKGKVPRDIYEKHFGKESLFLEAADSVLQQAYIQALTDSKLVPIIQPSVDLTSIGEDHVEFKFVITTKPTVKVKKYKGLGVKPKEVKVTKEEIDHEVSHLLEHYAEMKTKESGKVEKGNIAIIDFEGFKDGKPFDGGKGENYSLEIGSNTFIPGFEDGVIGMKVDEEKDIKLKFPKDYGAKDLAGKEVVFKVKVNEIKEKVSRELDEDFFEDLGMEDVTNEKELKDKIKESLTSQKKLQAENEYLERLLEEISKNVEVDIPQQLVDNETKSLKDKFAHDLSHQGINLDMYYQFTNSSEEDLMKELSKESYKNVLYRLMLEEIKNLEKIELEEKEVQKEAEEMAKRYQVTKEEFLEQFGGIEAVKFELEMNKTIEKLKEYNK